MLHPSSRKRFFWDMFGLLLIVYDMTTIPLDFFRLPDDPVFTVMAWTTAMYWTLDVGASSITMVYVEGVLQTTLRSVMKHYSRTWLAFDMCLVFSSWLGIIVKDNELFASMGFLRGFRVLRFVRLLRLAKFDRLFKQLQAHTNSNLVLLLTGIMKRLAMLVVVNHVIGCFWYGIGLLSEDEGWASSPDMKDRSLLYCYLTSVHWAIAQFHGDQDTFPVTEYERIFAVIVRFFALSCFSLFVSSITELMMQLHALRREKTKKIQALQGFLQENDISLRLSMKVRKYLEEQVEVHRRKEHEAELIGLLTPALLADIREEVRVPILSVHPFFSNLRDHKPRAIRRVCHEAMCDISAKKGENVFCRGDACTRMIFVLRMRLRYRQRNTCEELSTNNFQSEKDAGEDGAGVDGAEKDGAEKVDMDVGDQLVASGQWVSEAALWTPWENRGDLTVITEGRLLALSTTEFVEVVSQFTAVLLEVSRYAKRFVQEMNSDTKMQTDLPSIG